MVIPRLEQRGSAGLVTTTTTREGTTATDESLLRGAARTALATGVPLSSRSGKDVIHDLEIVLGENLPADRIAVGGLDRNDAIASGAHREVLARGVFLAIDNVGRDDEDHLTDGERAALVTELVNEGHTDRILLSSNAIGVAKGQPGYDLPFSYILSTFIPALRKQGIDQAAIQQILVGNPRELLTVR
jgi:phosphotriesterase-related protein